MAPAKPAHRGRALVAEDNVTNQRVAIALLANLGFRADGVGDGREAVLAVERVPYDIVFMDCQMPEMDGYAATAEIRRRERPGQRVPIVALTANVLQGERERCIQAGMDDYLPKPIDPAALGAMLDRWVLRSTSRAVVSDHSSGARVPGWAEVRDLYLSDATHTIARMEAAVAAARGAEVAALAHSLKGSSGVVGAKQMSSLCASLEAAVREGSEDRWAAIVREIREGFEQVRKSLP